MPGPFTVTITPKLFAEGEHEGQIEYLHFTATDGTHLHRWWALNTGTLGNDFRAIFGEWGPGLLERLRRGETVKLPRTFALEEIRGRIGWVGID
jgi:hypothetical protein